MISLRLLLMNLGEIIYPLRRSSFNIDERCGYTFCNKIIRQDDGRQTNQER